MTIKKPEVPGNLRALGYDWIPESLESVGKDVADVLKKNNAQCFLMDVHATGDQVYRNITCILEVQPELKVESELNIRYNRETGKSFVISEHLK